MDTKMQALQKAQELFMRLLNDGKQPCITNVESTSVGKYFCVSPVEIKEKSIFEYSDQKPLERDTLVKEGNVFRWAFGELDDNGINLFYPKGWNSKSNIALNVESLIPVHDFEIIETPGEFERVQTHDEQCIYFGCSKYVKKWQRVESDKFLNGDCERCRIPIGTPSNFMGKK